LQIDLNKIAVMSVMTAFYTLGYDRNATPHEIHTMYKNGFDLLIHTSNMMYLNAVGFGIDFSIYNILTILYIDNEELIDDFLDEYGDDFEETIH
jgi:hypothetical protein